MKSKFHRIHLNSVPDRLAHNRWFFLLLLFLFYHLRKQYNFVTPSFAHWRRIGRVIDNVEKYSEPLSLEYVMDNPEFATFADTLKSMSQPPYVIFTGGCFLRRRGGKEAQFNCSICANGYSGLQQSEEDLENKKYVTYQLILLLRARVAAALATLGIDFWAMQQDSIWTTNFGDLELENEYSHANLIFDTVGNDQFRLFNLMKGWICGSTFFVRSSSTTANFFQMVASIMTKKQSPDSSIMTYLCGAAHYKCAKLPRSIVSSSNYFLGNRNVTPAMIQIDHESKLSKIELFKKNKLYFREKDGSCHADAVKNIGKIVSEALPEVETKDLPDDTALWLKIWRATKEYIGFDPYRHKVFLTVHHSLV